MSAHQITLIPQDPNFEPTREAEECALALFREFVHAANEIEATLTKEVRFFPCVENLECIHCPWCDADIIEWWWKEFGVASETDFQKLMRAMPCCGHPASLNNVHFRWPMGFAQFALVAEQPDVGELTAAQLEQLQDVLGCSLRMILVHM